ncbi:FAD-dependent oxidoreductase [Marinobacter vulgaris]|uniref:FAD-dependent oxidoreductase n=1 Tax=Marinobacter vulgaris TaxID=1928331 RepID=A0A2V3ZG00_9GAMM|nr:FAD-dependent oxidoreductase [Marinobacter vulgaris]PXX89543.1 FAD-dependent oxidoreductase [Marinobacter vulgaris]TSJ68533.1 FAD-binding oxidoreductase [Marinobacter vulgaris]
MPDLNEAMMNNHSFWQYKYGDYSANAALPPGSHETDVLVIGAGYTGLTCAREVRKDDHTKRVMVFDANEIGFGASGRNGGFNMTLFGIEPEVTMLRWGKEKTREAQSYMQKAVQYVKDLIEAEKLDSDYQHTGMLRIAYTNKQAHRLKKTYALLSDITKPGSFEYWSGKETQKRVNCPHIKAAIFEPGTGILDPCKHVRSLKMLAEREGAEIFENTRVIGLSRQSGASVVQTDVATIRAKKLVIATNAWTHKLKTSPKVANVQAPVWTYQIVTAPLTPEQWKRINWKERMSIEDNRQLVHYMRITTCGRITMGGGSIGVEYNDRKMALWKNEKVWRALERHLKWMFPALADIDIHYKWGGCISANVDMTPEIGFIGDSNIIYATGCIGHGVSLTQLNGRLIADLVLGRETGLAKFWIVNRRAIPLPPGKMLRFAGIKFIEGVLNAVDWYEEGGSKKPRN